MQVRIITYYLLITLFTISCYTHQIIAQNNKPQKENTKSKKNSPKAQNTIPQSATTQAPALIITDTSKNKAKPSAKKPILKSRKK